MIVVASLPSRSCWPLRRREEIDVAARFSKAQKPSAEIIVLAEYRRRFVHDRPHFCAWEEA